MGFTRIYRKWIKQELYDLGWGNENGFIRLPKLDFGNLWNLLVNSSIQENKYGAAYILEKEYPDSLLAYLLTILNSPNFQINAELKEAFKVLQLDLMKNRSEIIGKLFDEIDKDYNNWKYVTGRNFYL